LSGAGRWVEMSLNKVAIEAGDMVIAVARDVTERKRNEERVRYHATHDALTTLSNRRAFQEQLAARLAGADRRGALLVFDIDRFREMNESLGHATGDDVLRATATRLTALVAAAGGPAPARVGSNEFALWLPGAGPAEAQAFTAQLQARLAEPLGGVLGHLGVDVSAGVALHPEHAADAEALLRCAEVAMYHARSRRLRTVLYDPREDRPAGRLRLIGNLRHAIEHRQVTARYQPIVHLAEPRRVRVEALACWQDAEHGNVLPAEFVALAEHTGMIRALTQCVAERALAECAPLIRAGAIESVSINLSALSLTDPAMPQQWHDWLRAYDLPPSAVTLEVTESAIMEDPAGAGRMLSGLRALGIRIAIDDFGTGHSSLAKLRQLPVAELKIDRAFVRELHRNEGDAAIVRAAIQLAHAFGCQVVAEGVEDHASLNMLRELGCDFGQGYAISRPMAHAELTGWLAKRAR
jgi:diguanylate cyclase (GGDEF)-like protein